jgi:hypothetical protein
MIQFREWYSKTENSSLKFKLSRIGVSINDVRIQGSSLRTEAAGDIDLAVVINQSEFDNYLINAYGNRIRKNGQPVVMNGMNHQDLSNLAKDIVENTQSYNSISRSDFLYNFENQIIKATPDKGVIPGFRPLLDEIQRSFQH